MSNLVPVPPTYTYISAGLLNNIRREATRFMLHRYTRRSRAVVDGTFDEWGHQALAPGSIITDIPCYFYVKDTDLVTAQGLVAFGKPYLMVLWTDTLGVGDVISNVVALDGSPVNLEPMIVENITPRNVNVDGAIYIEAGLREYEFVTP